MMRDLLLKCIFFCSLVFNSIGAISLEDLPIRISPHLALGCFETLRDQTEFTDPSEFELSTLNRVGTVLGNPHALSFSLEDEESIHQTLFSFIRTRHYYSGKPGLVSEFFWDQKYLETNPQYLKHMQLLAMVDILVLKSLWNMDFEKIWGTCTNAKSYSPEILKVLTEDLLELEPTLNFKKETISSLLESHPSFFEDAFHIYTLFAPKLFLGDFYEELLTCSGTFRGWEVEGLDGLALWPSVGSGNYRQEVLNLMGKNSHLQLNSITSRGAICDETLLIEYEFFPFFIKTPFQLPPLKFRFKRALLGPVGNFAQKFSHQQNYLSTKKSSLLIKNTLSSKICGSLSETDLRLKKKILEELLYLKDPEMCYNYALMFYGEEAEMENLKKARYYFKFAADRGIKSAQIHYAKMLQFGKGGPENKSLGRRYFKLEADRGDMMAQFSYAACLGSGGGGPQNLPASRPYYQSAADQGHPRASKIFAGMLYSGEGGSQDLEGARHYFKLAANQGDLESQFNYAFMLENEMGGPKDLEGARHYFRLAAEKGQPQAQCSYAIMLYCGGGGPTDLSAARHYFELSANQGNPQARENLAKIS